MDKEQVMEALKRAITVLAIDNVEDFVKQSVPIVAFVLGRMDHISELNGVETVQEVLLSFSDEGITYEELYNQLTEENNAE